ncbi:MAG: hypothetical protein H6652_13360 [Ardenticatenaceae bacterium]|nr:hypothetical protein [Ardenticatenaceae bacterium]MCB8947266.1 hypothetical protein [Ardenticatenaceae bacterium]
MESLITVILVVTLILFAGLNIFQETLDAQDALTTTWQEMEEISGDRARTMLTPISSTVKSNGAIVEVIFKNEGATKLADFDRWDLVMQYYTDSASYEIDWLPYVDTYPGSNQWTNAGIYVDAATGLPEAFEPGILNPGEEMVVQVQLMPTIGMTTTNMLTIGTEYGIQASTIITR